MHDSHAGPLEERAEAQSDAKVEIGLAQPADDAVRSAAVLDLPASPSLGRSARSRSSREGRARDRSPPSRAASPSPPARRRERQGLREPGALSPPRRAGDATLAGVPSRRAGRWSLDAELEGKPILLAGAVDPAWVLHTRRHGSARTLFPGGSKNTILSGTSVFFIQKPPPVAWEKTNSIPSTGARFRYIKPALALSRREGELRAQRDAVETELAVGDGRRARSPRDAATETRTPSRPRARTATR